MKEKERKDERKDEQEGKMMKFLLGKMKELFLSVQTAFFHL